MQLSWFRGMRVVPALLFAGFPLLFLLALAVFQLTSAMPEAQRARAETRASFQTLRDVSAVDQAVQDAERGQRGFLITGRDVYLEPYEHAKAELPGLMSQLRRAIQGDSNQEDRLLKLQADLTTKMNELAATITTYRAAGFDGAKSVVDTDVGRNSMVSILADLADISDAETARLGARSAQAEQADRRVTGAFVAGSVVSGLALISGALLLGFAHGRVAASEQALKSTLDSVREGVAAFDGSGRLQSWNEPFVKLLDLSSVRLVRDAPVAIDRETSAAAAEVLGRINELDVAVRRTGRPALVTYKTPRGATLEVFHNRVNDGHVTTVLDVSEQRQAEEALRQAQKLEAIGHMTGAVAHDFNNLLTIVIGSLAYLRRFGGQDRKLSERVDMLEIAAQRGARLTRQLLAFARRQPLEPAVVNLGRTMQEILPLVRRAVGDAIVVESVVTAGAWNTTIDADQFQSAILNLAINSLHAMPGGGKLTIEVANAALDDTYAARHADLEPGQYVMFAITDTGTGMDAATVARAMDPFFTTKPAGLGTGLGLAQVYGFVKQSGGHIKIYSELNEGTTVRIYLPRSLQMESHDAGRPAGLAVTGTETILLVDDDEIVRATVSSMLEDLGYTVRSAPTGAQALEILAEDPEIALLFTDVVMPAMSGRQLAERALSVRPDLRILFTSGYTENAIVHNGRLDQGVELLSKPYDRERLAARLRRVLDAPRAAGSEGSAKVRS
jgi:signal transduction histidine kinase/CHASE3 domain sensor protein/ActR/RegA family two-component response regulator